MSETTPEDTTVPKSDIEAKREARKRRILENAKTRLEKINGSVGGREHVTSEKAEPIIYPDPEIEHADDIPLSPPAARQSFGNYDDFVFGNASSMEDMLQANEQLFQMFNQFNSQQGPPNWNGSPAGAAPAAGPRHPPTTKLALFLRTKLHIVLISMLTFALFVTGNESYISYSVFFPLLIWELTEAFLLKSYEKPSTSLFSVVFLFAGVSPMYSNTVLKVVETFNKIFKDVGVFVFFFALCQVTFSTFFKPQVVDDFFDSHLTDA